MYTNIPQILRTSQAVGMILVTALVLGACGSQPTAVSTNMQPTIAPKSVPTAMPEPTLAPTPTLQPVPTLPPAEATITFERKACTYEGPHPIPANMTFAVNWYVNSNDSDLYGLYVFIVGDGMTKDDLVAALKREGAPPSWLTQAGSFETGPNSSLQVVVKTASGPLFGPLYFTCWGKSESGPFQSIGPIEVE